MVWYKAVGLLLVVSMLCDTRASLMTIQNNRYDNLVIAISPEVTEDRHIILNIQRMVSEASPYLFEATRNRSYFGDVKILVPDTWSRDASWVSAGAETFEEADIRIDEPHPVYGNDPYTFQPEGCGDPGKYIHLTEEYVLDRLEQNIYTYGPSGRILVHEFAHLRYGVFDEYGLNTTQYPLFYLEDGLVNPTACMHGMRGNMYGDNCVNDPITGMPGEGCYFLADADQNTAKASIMYDAAVKSVTTFCESGVNDTLHNAAAPNLHNRMCNNRGTWDVIKEHKDFKGVNPPTSKTPDQLKPSFIIIYGGGGTSKTPGKTSSDSCWRPVVLVLDVSGSMDLNNRLFKQRQVSSTLIKDILPEGTLLGIVQFATIAKLRFPLTHLNSASDRTHASNAVPTTTDGSTSIGSGLRMATQMLVRAGARNKGRIILITDGEENGDPRIGDVMGEVKAAGIRVHAIAYSKAADTRIQVLTAETGGFYTYYTESASSTQLQSAIEEFSKDMCNKDNKIQITRTAVSLAANTNSEGDVLIDPSLRNNTVFIFTLPGGVNVRVTVKAPDNTVYNAGSIEYYKDASLNIIKFKFPFAQTGRWHYILRGPSSGNVVLVVKAERTSNAAPYEVKSWMSSSHFTLSDGSKNTVPVYVHVHKGYSPVIDAKVTVKVERPNATPVILGCHDDGAGADTLKSDGVYSAFFHQFTDNDRYSLDVSVETIFGKTKYYLFDGNGTIAYGRSMPRFHNTTVPPKKVLADNFTRTTSPGAIDVEGFKPGVDQIAPFKISDLTVVSFNSEAGTVTLTWTAPGDDATSGTAYRYHIRVAKTAHELLTSSPSCVLITPAMLVSGSLKPQTAGAEERLTITTPHSWTSAVISVQAVDEAGHTSDMSNMASASFMSTTKPQGHEQVKVKGASGGTIAVSVVCGVIVGVIVMGTASVIFIKKKMMFKGKLGESGGGKKMPLEFVSSTDPIVSSSAPTATGTAWP